MVKTLVAWLTSSFDNWVSVFTIGPGIFEPAMTYYLPILVRITTPYGSCGVLRSSQTQSIALVSAIGRSAYQRYQSLVVRSFSTYQNLTITEVKYHLVEYKLLEQFISLNVLIGRYALIYLISANYSYNNFKFIKLNQIRFRIQSAARISHGEWTSWASSNSPS